MSEASASLFDDLLGMVDPTLHDRSGAVLYSGRTAPERSEQRVTVYDDRHDVYRTEDLERIRDLSEFVPLSARNDVVALLAA